MLVPIPISEWTYIFRRFRSDELRNFLGHDWWLNIFIWFYTTVLITLVADWVFISLWRTFLNAVLVWIRKFILDQECVLLQSLLLLLLNDEYTLIMLLELCIMTTFNFLFSFFELFLSYSLLGIKVFLSFFIHLTLLSLPIQAHFALLAPRWTNSHTLFSLHDWRRGFPSWLSPEFEQGSSFFRQVQMFILFVTEVHEKTLKNLISFLLVEMMLLGWRGSIHRNLHKITLMFVDNGFRRNTKRFKECRFLVGAQLLQFVQHLLVNIGLLRFPSSHICCLF